MDWFSERMWGDLLFWNSPGPFSLLWHYFINNCLNSWALFLELYSGTAVWEEQLEFNKEMLIVYRCIRKKRFQKLLLWLLKARWEWWHICMILLSGIPNLNVLSVTTDCKSSIQSCLAMIFRDCFAVHTGWSVLHSLVEVGGREKYENFAILNGNGKICQVFLSKWILHVCGGVFAC